MENSQEFFNPDYYNHILLSLTINSRALITELTSIAEKNLDNAEEICNLIELRIKKCVPQYKLFTFYLMDSICKNIGTPYNIIFSNNLYKYFTETYSIVTDTPNRQGLINLFKTWINAKTNTGLKLFPESVLNKIENFIIKATSITGNSSNVFTNGSKCGLMSLKLTSDVLLKESRSLLQYILTLNNNIDSEIGEYTSIDANDKKTIDESQIKRNHLVLNINDIHDEIINDFKVTSNSKITNELNTSLNFITEKLDKNLKQYQIKLQNIRKELDLQHHEQDEFIKKLKAKFLEKDLGKKKKKIIIRESPVLIFFKNISDDLKNNSEIYNCFNSWGKFLPQKSGMDDLPTIIKNDCNKNNNVNDLDHKNTSESEEMQNQNNYLKQDANEFSNNSLGFNFFSLDFFNSILNNPNNEKKNVNEKFDIAKNSYQNVPKKKEKKLVEKSSFTKNTIKSISTQLPNSLPKIPCFFNNEKKKKKKTNHSNSQSSHNNVILSQPQKLDILESNNDESKKNYDISNSVSIDFSEKKKVDFTLTSSNFNSSDNLTEDSVLHDNNASKSENQNNSGDVLIGTNITNSESIINPKTLEIIDSCNNSEIPPNLKRKTLDFKSKNFVKKVKFNIS